MPPSKLTTVVNLSAGALLGPGTIYVGRAGRGLAGTFGNPHRAGDFCSCGTPHATRAEAIAAFARYFYARLERDPAFWTAVLELRGKRLACFCVPHACHASVIAAYLNELPEEGPGT